MKHNDITIIVLLYKTPKKLIKNLVNYNNFKISILDQSGDYKLKKNSYKTFTEYCKL